MWLGLLSGWAGAVLRQRLLLRHLLWRRAVLPVCTGFLCRQRTVLCSGRDVWGRGLRLGNLRGHRRGLLHWQRLLQPECLRCWSLCRGMSARLPGVRPDLLPRGLLHRRRLWTALRGLRDRSRLPLVRGGRAGVPERNLCAPHDPHAKPHRDTQRDSDAKRYRDPKHYHNPEHDRDPKLHAEPHPESESDILRAERSSMRRRRSLLQRSVRRHPDQPGALRRLRYRLYPRSGLRPACLLHAVDLRGRTMRQPARRLWRHARLRPLLYRANLLRRHLRQSANRPSALRDLRSRLPGRGRLLQWGMRQSANRSGALRNVRRCLPSRAGLLQWDVCRPPDRLGALRDLR
jgi:hypothetical protein